MKFGNVTKSLGESTSEITDNMLAKINLYTRKALTADEVYVFPIVMCDNEIDRDYEHFTIDALKGFAEMFKGKTVICDHNRKSANQCARIFDTEVIHNSTVKTFDGQDLYQLKAYAYMLRNDANAETIANIDAGIYKEVSVSCSAKTAKCSVCHKDYYGAECMHYAGREYEEGKICHVTLDGAKDAYELSFVAVPAQPGAMITKSKWFDDDDKIKKGMKKTMDYEKAKSMLLELGIDLDGIAKSESKAEGEIPSLEAILTAVKKSFSECSKSEKSFITADTVKTAAGKDMTADEVCKLLSKSTELEKKAGLYDSIKAKAIEEACKSGIKAKGESFSEERYKKMFESFTVDEINGQAKDWEDEAKSLFKSGRKSEDEDNEKSFIKPNLNF